MPLKLACYGRERDKNAVSFLMTLLVSVSLACLCVVFSKKLYLFRVCDLPVSHCDALLMSFYLSQRHAGVLR